jgi:hypothetical protein
MEEAALENEEVGEREADEAEDKVEAAVVVVARAMLHRPKQAGIVQLCRISRTKPAGEITGNKISGAKDGRLEMGRCRLEIT